MVGPVRYSFLPTLPRPFRTDPRVFAVDNEHGKVSDDQSPYGLSAHV